MSAFRDRHFRTRFLAVVFLSLLLLLLAGTAEAKGKPPREPDPATVPTVAESSPPSPPAAEPVPDNNGHGNKGNNEANPDGGPKQEWDGNNGSGQELKEDLPCDDNNGKSKRCAAAEPGIVVPDKPVKPVEPKVEPGDPPKQPTTEPKDEPKDEPEPVADPEPASAPQCTGQLVVMIEGRQRFVIPFVPEGDAVSRLTAHVRKGITITVLVKDTEAEAYLSTATLMGGLGNQAVYNVGVPNGLRYWFQAETVTNCLAGFEFQAPTK